jgi:hypothetical protein
MQATKTPANNVSIRPGSIKYGSTPYVLIRSQRQNGAMTIKQTERVVSAIFEEIRIRIGRTR